MTTSWWTILMLAACSADDQGDSASLAVGTLSVTTDAGRYALEVTPTPDPVVVGDAHLAVRLSDADGAATTGATLTITPWMPSMNHGIMGEVAVTEGEGGFYEAAFAYSMPGAWEVTVAVSATPGDDQVTLPFEVY